MELVASPRLRDPMNPLMVCNKLSFRAFASAKEPSVAKYYTTTWTTRPAIVDRGTVRSFLGIAGMDCAEKVVLKATKAAKT